MRRRLTAAVAVLASSAVSLDPAGLDCAAAALQAPRGRHGAFRIFSSPPLTGNISVANIIVRFVQ